jgi:hypothetical protein
MSTKCSTDIKKDIVKSVGKMLSKEGAFIEGDFGYFYNPRNATREANKINRAFKTLVVKEGERGSFYIDPSPQLVNLYFEEYKKSNGLISRIAPKGFPVVESSQVVVQKDIENNIKPGVEELFESNPELSDIGTTEQYSAYLDSIFPDSQVKDVVYHGSNTTFDGFLEDNLNYFGTKEIAKGYGKNLYPSIIEIKKPYYEDGGNLSNQSYEDLYDKLDESNSDGFISNSKTLFVPKTEEQIHILGNKQDVEGFKKFVKKTETKQPEVSEVVETATQEVVLTKKAKEDFVIGNTLQSIKPNITEDQLKDIYENYLNLMDRKREGKGVDYKTFTNRVVKNLQVFNYNDTYIFGEWDSNNNVFKARFISAPGIRQLYLGIDLLSSNVDVVASTPEDIGNMLLKKGFVKLNVDKFYDFKGEDMVKNLYFSRPELIEKVFKKSAPAAIESVTPKVDIINYRNVTKEDKTAAVEGDIAAQEKWMKEEIAEFYEAVDGYNKGTMSIDDVGEETLGLFRTMQQFPEVKSLTNPYIKDIFTVLNSFDFIEQYTKFKDKKTSKNQASEMTLENLSSFIDSVRPKTNEITAEDVNKYDAFFNYRSLIRKLKKAYASKDNDSIYSILKELGLYDYSAYRLSKKLKSGNLTDEDVDTTIKTIIKNSSLNKVNIDKQDLLNNPKIYNELDTELNKSLANFLSKFGIKTDVISNIQNDLNIDSHGMVDILNKIIYVKDNKLADYPQQAGYLIAYMMQHNPLITEITSSMERFGMFKKDFRSLPKNEKLKVVGDLIAAELHRKTRTDLPSGLIEQIKSLIRQFFDLFTKQRMNRINRNVGIIADNVLLQNQSIITASQFKPGAEGKVVNKIGLEEALKTDEFANSIVDRMSSYFILTGSITLAEQGTVYRPSENQVHDLDWVSSYGTEETIKLFEELYPNSKKIRVIDEPGSPNRTDTWVVPPDGYTIENLVLKSPGNRIVSYNIVDEFGDTVSVYDGKTDSHSGEVEAKLIDIFSYTDVNLRERDSASMPFTLPSGKKLRLSDWRVTFGAKLRYARLKDIWDYNRFIPTDNIFTEELQAETEPSPSDIYFQMQDTEKEQREVNKKLRDKIERFLEKIGVSIQAVDEIRDAQGNKVNAVAAASMLNKVVRVIEGLESLDTLPEEAAHFFVEMLGEGHPLYKEMVGKITNYKVYRDTYEKYKNVKDYRNADGTVNFDKIKKEAIGKMIAEHIIKLDAGAETESNLIKAVTWWQKLWEFVKSIFAKSEVNPFEDAATKILLGETEDLTMENIQDDEYYQLVDPLQGLLNDQGKINLDNSIDPRTGQKRHIYTYEKKQAKGSVTSVYVDKWLKKIFKGSDYRTDLQRIIDLTKAEFGDIVHEQVQDIVRSLTNPDGTRRETQDTITPKTDPVTFNVLNTYIQKVMDQYTEPGTVFLSEVKIFDKRTEIAGSIDLLIIKPDGVVDIYDWKTQEVFKDQTDIKTYKEPMYRIQLDNYRKILETQYGFTKFGKIRAIPIATQFNFRDGKPLSIRSIEVGSIDPSLIPDSKSYLLPVTLKTESTGNTELDGLIEKLYGIYDKIDKKRYSGEELFRKREELGQLRIAIRDLQLRGEVNRLIDLGLIEFKKYSEKLNSKTLTGGDIPEALSILKVFGDSGTMLYELREEIASNIDPENKDAIAKFEAQTKKFLLMTSKVSKLINDIQTYRDQQSKELGEKNGIFNLLNPEKAVGTLKGWFSALSKITQKSFRVFSKLLRTAQSKRDAKFDKTAADLKELKENFVKWASSKGLNTDSAMAMLLNIDDKGNWNGNFLTKYKPEFNTLYRKAVEDGDSKWLTENLIFDDEKYKEAEKKQLEFFKTVIYSANEEENQKLVNEKIKGWVDSHRVIKPNGTINLKALYNSENLYRYLNPKEAWFSDKWKDLNKSENKPLKEVYDYFQNLIRYSEGLGMLDKYSPGFIPSIAKNKLDQLVFGDIKGLFSRKGVFEGLEVDNGEKYTPEIDPTTGEVINRIPVYFTKDMGIEKEDGTKDYTKKSRDLFKVFGTWAAHMYNYEAMDSIQDDAFMLLETEKNKSSLVTDAFGNVIIENGRVKAKDENKRNAQLLEEFVNYYIYDKTSGVVSDKKLKIFGKEYSALKGSRGLMALYSLKTLALNIVSGTANFVSGIGNVLFQAQKGTLFTKKGWAQAAGLAIGNKKAQAALKYLNILQEGTERTMIDNLSLSSTNKILKKDNLFIVQRLGDKAVQYPVGVSLMMNHMLEDGKIVDIQQWVKNKYDYNNTFYNLSDAERKALRNKIDEEVGKLQKERSLLKIGVLDNEGNFSIPGIDKESEEMADFRNKIKGIAKKILGNNGRDDINNIRTGMLGSALMQFRNWMPELVEERLGGLKYDDELNNWSYGRYNQFFKDLLSVRAPRLALAIATGFGSNAIQLAKDSYERMKAEAYEKGEEWTITEGEFIDMYVGNLKAMITELVVILLIGLAYLSVTSGDDDDDKGKGMKAYVRRSLSKYFSEFAFFLDPSSFTSILNKPLPVIGLAEDFRQFTVSLIQEGYATAAGNKKLKKKAQPAKYFFRMVPIAKEALLTTAIFDDEFRKEWDIRINTGY